MEIETLNNNMWNEYLKVHEWGREFNKKQKLSKIKAQDIINSLNRSIDK